MPLGTITIDKLAANTPKEDKATQFNPANHPAGIEMADEAVKLRVAAYPISVKRAGVTGCFNIILQLAWRH